VIVLSTKPPRSFTQTAYLTWLKDATTSLVSDVKLGRRQQPNEITLATSISGLEALTSVPMLSLLMSSYVGASMIHHATTADAAGLYIASSCGSGGGCGGGSSCGGGGGCGGGGCS
jgi:hypothetical protein